MKEEIRKEVAIPLSSLKKAIIMVALIFGTFPQNFAAGSRAVILPTVMAEFGAMNLYSLALISGSIAMSLSLPVSGKLGDLFGRKRILQMALAVWMLAGFITARANSVFGFMAGVFLTGIAYGFSDASIKTTISDISTPEERPKRLSLLETTVALTHTLTPLLGGLFVDTIGWQWCYLIGMPLLVICFIIVTKELPDAEKKNGKNVTIDFKGLLCFVVAAVSLLVLLALGGSQIPWFSAPFFALLAVSILGWGALFYVEKRVESPIITFDLFRNSSYAKVFCVCLLVYISNASMSYCSVFNQNVRGLSATVSGSLMMPRAIFGIGITSMMGVLITKLGVKRVLAAETFFLAVGFAIMTTFTPNTGNIPFMLQTTIYSLGFSGVLVSSISMAQSTAQRAVVGAATSLISFTTSFGTSIGNALGGTFVGVAWKGAIGVIPEKIAGALSPAHMEALLNQATLHSTETIDAIRMTLSEDLHGLFDATIVALREQLMLGIRWLNFMCLGCAAVGFLIVLSLSGDKKEKSES